ncbi:putative penicillin-binding protein 1B [Corynebacterium glutamicum MB001]|uniref:Membrane carboxypeptidase (Penicillin-binding protein) n=1 Tax=Corynebacterium glutamicum (strain ATCC 13032 / DSM 20300 / JCM 1318 / BCRC 11384 / CCUG 27702 / LMG 3730 / NBRC 12168 / NCIMB 10025 / NRRL B-2784 / 534) TaxID=196627 RepID=Q8NTM8_CORGL|nr:transglycosylase domain-containing protein [Corynebacterium glutamicum]AGT04289.1 putative penicillin-binding protein 1B [Corynebacterium glutamicum MB001]ASW13068.1 putative penicillin-binding protein 1B [Corynebacterium glutamicum]AUH99900.1 penicillin-binding protein [Corynebacterium glutamicum]AUI03541.1 penicillin-binding protein [Corynebacterium glutamicum]MBA4569362.1 transglycosylase domain-containing protein [Corynebacterium glutamicum]
MSTTNSLTKLVASTVAAGVLGALALVPFASLSGVAVARTNDTMQTNLSDLTDGRGPGVTTITDSTDQPIAYIYAQRRFEVGGDQISTSMKDAIVSIEDRRFYEHDGVDLQGFGRAILTNLAAGGVEQGASTINQQYVKNFLLLVEADDEAEQAAAVETSIPRKLREMKMASDLEKTLSKDEILTRYLNIVPFGNGAYGVEAAARTYFGTSAAELTIPQSAMLAGIVQSSSYLNPYTNHDAVFERRNTVLGAMADAGAISPDEASAFQQEPLGVLETPQGLSNGCIGAGDRGFFCDYALQYLSEQGITQDMLAKDSYTIKLTLDPDVQDAAHNAVSSHVDPTTPGVAEVVNVIEPGENSRDILAITSSRNYGLDLDAGETMLPQATSRVGNGAGSIFKIFTAAAAIQQGAGLDTMLDVPSRYEVKGMGSGGAANCPANTYCVENAGSYAPRMTLQDALAQSPNTAFVEMIEQVGVDTVVDLSVKLGLRSYTDEGSFDGESSIADYMKDNNLGSYTLGPTAVNPLELSNVAATIASGGMWCEPNPIASVHDREGNEVYIDRPACERAIDAETASALAVGMSKDTVSGTAASAASMYGWSLPTAAKTGTTESNQSSAFMGFNSNFAAAPYIYNDGTSTTPLCSGPVRQCSSGNLFGGNEPAQTWFNMASNVPAASQGTLPSSSDSFRLGTSGELLNQVVGQSEASARRTLEAKGYKVTTRSVSGAGSARGTVVSATPQGAVLIDGGTVILDISDGTSPAPAATNNDDSDDGDTPAPSTNNRGTTIEDAINDAINQFFR